MKDQPARFRTLFPERCPVIAMIHVAALPGTPAYGGQMEAVIAQAISEAELYRDHGVDGIIIENMHDAPYLNRVVGHEISTAVAVIARAVRAVWTGPLGLQILAGANQAALAAALVAGADFIRAEGFVFGHVADEGWIGSDAGRLLRYRKQIGAEHIQIFTDIKKKHSAHATTADVDLGETARAAEFFRSDALIVTGVATGSPARPEDGQAVRLASHLPVLIGSGINPVILEAYFPVCDGVIVGSWMKADDDWRNPPEARRIQTMVDAVRRLR
ncbi:MAG: BtpA/SgcQ family protein [Bacteroidota bacterium]